jgi:hypothetical protein
MSASPGEIVRIKLGADSNTTISDNQIVGTYEGPIISASATTLNNRTFSFDTGLQTPQLNFQEEEVFGIIGSSATWTAIHHPIAIEFRQFVKESEDGRGIVCFTEWAMKNCDGTLLRQVRDAYRAKYGQNVMFDGDSMFYMLDRCKRLEERLDKLE